MKSNEHPAAPAEKKVPKSFIVRTGSLKTAALQELVLNLRKVMEPNTAMKLKERKNGKLKDYVAVAGNLGVTHMAFLSQTLMHTTLRLGHFPRGPSLYFDVLRYSLMKDVHHAHEKPASLGGIEYKHAPLVILDGFDKTASRGDASSNEVSLGDKEKNLLSIFLQNMFPAIHVPTMHVSDAKRVLLFYLCPETDELVVRHYIVKMRESTDREAAEMIKEKLASERKDDNDKPSTAAKQETAAVAQKAVIVSEVGPRLTLKLTKIMDGFMDDMKGKVLYSRFPRRLEPSRDSSADDHADTSSEEFSQSEEELVVEEKERDAKKLKSKKRQVTFQVGDDHRLPKDKKKRTMLQKH